MFELISFDNIGSERGVTAAIINVYTAYVEVRNITDRLIIINRKRRLGIIEEYGIEKCYLVTEKSKSLAIGRISWVRKILIVDILIFAAANLATLSPDFITIMIEIDILKEIIIDFEITVYGDITIR
jgi:hypothetical protein